MTKMPNKVALPTSIKRHSNIQIGGVNLTTMDFGVTNVAYCREVLPTDSIKGNVNTFVQLAPMVVPTMGEATLYTRAFFIPYRFIWRAYEAFAENKANYLQTVLNGVPYVSLKQLAAFLFPYTPSTMPSVGYKTDTYEVVGSDDAYDFNLAFIEDAQDSSQTDNAHVRLTPYGRDCYSILRSLGYVVPPISTRVSNHIVDKNVSAMPLLSLAKVFRDYYVNPNYDYHIIDALFELTNTFNFTAYYIKLILDFCRYAWYKSDVFTSAWASPEVVGYTPQYYKDLEFINSIEIQDGDILTDEFIEQAQKFAEGYRTTYINLQSSSISQAGLNILQALRNKVIRQNSAGARYIDQMLSKYGIRIPENEARRSQLIGFAESKLNISRVDATSAGSDGTNSSMLGDFVGRGTMNGSGSFIIDNMKNDFGCLIVLNHIIPETHYYQGMNPELNHLYLSDFWDGDLETTANAPIPYSAVYGQYDDAAAYKRDSADDTRQLSVFGFSANYWENKVSRDILSGDFILGSRNTELQSFHMFRKLYPASALDDHDNAAVLSSEFQQMTDQNVESYTKIFNDTSNFNCHFIVHQIFDVNANRPCFPLQETMVSEIKENLHGVTEVVTVRPNGKYF